jgi:predicted metalloprotease
LVVWLGGSAGGTRAQDGQTGGVEGNHYVSPTYGYELTWGDEWTVQEEASEGGYDYLFLTNETTNVYLEGYLGYGGDPAACLEDNRAQLAKDADNGELTIAQGEDGSDMAGEEEGLAYAVYDYTVTYEDGNVVATSALVQCMTLQEGASVLVFTAIVSSDSYNDEIDAIVALLSELAVPDAGSAATMADVEPFMRTVEEDLTEFWTKTLDAEGIEYEAPAFITFDAPIETGCGEFAPQEAGPFYCPADRTVYLDLVDMQETELPYGEFVVAIVLAHEVGHHIQEVMSLQGCEITACVEGARSLEMELQADCFAGAWAQDANERGLLQGGDLEQVVVAVAEFFGDEPGTPANDPQAHGPGALRTWWLLRGYYEGVDACLTAVDEGKAGTG